MFSFDDTHKETKKKYIFENIEKIKNHKNYLDIVEFHNCQHTKNSNGIFLNLHTLDEEVINKIYYKLRNEIEDEGLTENIIEKKIIPNSKCLRSLFRQRTAQRPLMPFWFSHSWC